MTKKEWRKLDRLISKTAKEDKDYTCEECSRTKEQGWQIHHHHFVKRTKTSLRWILHNIFILCAKCHWDWEVNPKRTVEMAVKLRGDKWLKEISQLETKINLFDLETNITLMDKSLKEIIKKYK